MSWHWASKGEWRLLPQALQPIGWHNGREAPLPPPIVGGFPFLSQGGRKQHPSIAALNPRAAACGAAEPVDQASTEGRCG